MTRFEGRRALVVGGGGSIGAAIARRLADEGAAVVVADRDVTSARQVAGDVQGLGIGIEVTDEDSVSLAVQEAVDSLGGLDIVASTVGHLPVAWVEDLTASDWRDCLEVNATGAFLLARAAIPHLRHAGGGAMLLSSSTSGLRGTPGEGAYAAAKAAVIGLTRVLAAELARDGIRVNCLCPGWVDTPFNDPAWDFLGGKAAAEAGELAGIPLRRQATPAEVAAVAAFALSDDASYLTGVALPVDGGATAT